ncbi:uncharacterized protein [Zea mays]|jgi:hypothetical protein|uniref:Uncharacterized protein n=1 Tax=Zea mays TaxID=4577 RepID=C4JAH9_MAIZE|nr:uncharacterized protein LOC111590575 [Zea mays]ACR38179.1 unknown [Zea mays]|eukprot:XP_023157145.1 uncharacterized protein LOC111590575 [Zea mays]
MSGGPALLRSVLRPVWRGAYGAAARHTCGGRFGRHTRGSRSVARCGARASPPNRPLDSQNAVHTALLTLTTTTCVGAAVIYSQNSSLPSPLPCYQPSQRRGRAATGFFPPGKRCVLADATKGTLGSANPFNPEPLSFIHASDKAKNHSSSMIL